MLSAAVESISAHLGKTALNEPTPADTNGTAGGENNAQTDAINASAAEGRRLYIGNLAYATTEGELKEFFKDYLVESASIPTNPRTTRPVGYAFVDLSTATEAERAISELNGATILERKVSVQLARKPESGDGGVSGGEGASGNENRRRQSGRGRGRGRGGRFRGRGGRRNAADNAEGANDGANNAPVSVPGEVDPLADTTNEAAGNQQGADGGKPNKSSKPRVPRERKQRGPPEDGVPSKTKVMVANLPYDLREDKLLELFGEYQPVAAKIALRPIPRFMVKKLQARNEPRKGRGFGFVTLASEELQQKACTDMNGKEIEGREIAVKVAIDSPGKEDEEGNRENVGGQDTGVVPVEGGNAAT